MVEQKFGAGVGVLILNNEGKILLGRRHEDPEKASSELGGSGTWTMPGGKLGFQEGFEDAAKREVLEETGMRLKDLKVIAVNNDVVENAHFITVGLFSDHFEGEPRVMEPEEITEWKWFSLKELPDNLYFPSAKLLKNFLERKFYIKPEEKRIEVELRSFVSKDDYERLLRFFHENANFVKEDFQEMHYFDCKQDLRIQKNSSGAKIWMKKGQLHDAAREEIEIKTSGEDFETLGKLFNNLGHCVEIKWLRDRKQFNWEEVKVCLDYTKGYGYILELEKIGTEGNKEEILWELEKKLNSLNIPLTTREEFEQKFNYYKQNWRDLIDEK